MGVRTSREGYLADYPGNLAQFGGTIRYVSDADGADMNLGTSPLHPLKTIGRAITLSGPGDAISIKAGTYTEGLDMNVQALELWPELGTILAPATGTALTVSASFCRVAGDMRIDPIAAKGVDIVNTANFVYLRDLRVNGNSTGTVGYDIQGDGCVLDRCRCADPTVSAFKVQGDHTYIANGCTSGNAATIGFHVTNASDGGCLTNCGSVGHQSAGYRVDAGVTHMDVKDCSSGADDGRWIDNGTNTTWPNFKFDEVKHKTITLDAHNITKAYNLFKVTGIVKIRDINSRVTGALSANHTDCYIDLWDGAVSVPLFDPTGLILNTAPVKSLLVRNADAAQMLDYGNSSSCFKSENPNYKEPETEIIVGQKGDGSDTWVRFVHSTTDAPSSGELHWHMKWEPKSDNGFVAPA